MADSTVQDVIANIGITLTVHTTVHKQSSLIRENPAQLYALSDISRNNRKEGRVIVTVLP